MVKIKLSEIMHKESDPNGHLLAFSQSNHSIQMDWVCWSVLQTAVLRGYFECVFSLFSLAFAAVPVNVIFLSHSSILSDRSRRLSYFKNTLT